jgi:hypothetical protein
MGDVNADNVNATWNLTPRTNKTLPLYIRKNEVDQTYDVLLSEDASVYGFQMSLDARDLVLIGGQLAVDESNMALDKDGYSRISWGQTTSTELKKDDVLFTIGNLPLGKTLEEILMVDEEGLFPEIYTENLKNQKIALQPYQAEGSHGIFETKITPNPFSDNTKLQITIPSGEEFFVYLYDIKGREIFKRRYITYTDKADVVIGPELISVPGIYYYRVTSNLGDLSGKFIKQ